jgi:short-subunit dehydrogenase
MNGKLILITGAGSGIGKDAAFALTARGHRVIATTLTQEQADEVTSESKGKIESFKLDICNPADRALIEELDIDVLINNAAMGESGSLAEVDMERVRRIFEVNLFSTLELAQLAIQKMAENKGGSVLFVSSIAGRVPFPFLMPYSMTKFALSAGAAGLRAEMEILNKNIHVSVIEPGAFHTGFNQVMMNRKYEWMTQKSLFSAAQIERIQKRERKEFKLFEQKTTDVIIKKVVTAAEADKPKLRYTAPWIQGFAVHMKRVFGA